MRIAVIDDVKNEVSGMISLLKEIDGGEKMTVTGFSGTEAYKKTVEYGERFDVLFIDISLGEGKNGIAEATEILRLTPDIIIVFMSAYESYFKDVYKVPHAYFLTKPIDRTYLCDCIYRIKQAYSEHTVYIEKNGAGNIINLNDVVYFESMLRKTAVHYSNGSSDVFSMPLKDIEALIDSPSFVRIHKSFIVNLAYLRKLESAQVTMSDGASVSVSRPYRKDLRTKAAEFFARNAFVGTDIGKASAEIE